MEGTSNRQTNIELLRIVSMFLVLLYHSIFLKDGLPSHELVLSSPSQSFGNLFLYASSAICVNAFVLISGWFGIHCHKKQIGSFIFQVLFYFILGHIVILATGNSCSGTPDWFGLFTLSTEYWFVYAYLGLYLFSPILNSYIENASSKHLRRTLVFFFLLQTWYGWFRPQEAPFFYGGHSTISFVGLYLLARYLRLHTRFSKGKSSHSFLSFLFISLFTSTLAFIMLYGNIGAQYTAILFQYISPLILLASIVFFRGFIQWQLPSTKSINHMAVSAFSVYLIHTHSGFYIYMEQGIECIQQHFHYPIYIALLFCLLVGIYLVCTLMDQIRLLIWKQVSQKLE